MIQILSELQTHKEIVETFLFDKTVSTLVEEVQGKYNSNLIIKIDDTLESQGAYDWGRLPPTFLINPLTGLNKENLCHELVHSLQFTENFFYCK